MRKNGFASWSRVSAHQTFDVDSWLRNQEFLRFEEVHVMNPVLDALLLHDHRLVHTLRGLADHGFLHWAQWAGPIQKSFDRRCMPIGPDQRCKGFDQMPCRAV